MNFRVSSFRLVLNTIKMEKYFQFEFIGHREISIVLDSFLYALYTVKFRLSVPISPFVPHLRTKVEIPSVRGYKDKKGTSAFS
jgi:hypothetical protein